MKVIILAGGSGTRLWPLSRGRFPKQFIKFQNRDASLFQDTFNRSLMLTSPDEIFVVTNEKYKFLVMGEIEELGCTYKESNILVEPEAKNTLPAIYAGVHEILKTGNDYICVFPSDHMITKNSKFTNIIKSSKKLADESIITFGIKPDGPNTGYGYISPKEEKANGFLVGEFKEKPTEEKAIEYINLGYFWNAGIFMFDGKSFQEEVKTYSPEIYNAFESSHSLKDAFSKIETKISIDYGIMEKSNKVAVVPVEIGWNDLGSFSSFYDIFESDENNNISNENNILVESSNNLIHSEKNKLVATIGIDDLIIVDNRDALLICNKNEAQKVKQVVDQLKAIDDIRTEYHVEDYRPWGYYKILEEEQNKFKIKRITVNKGKKLSYQMHHHRSEHWVVVNGTARVTIDDVPQIVNAGESVFIRVGQKHRMENIGDIPMEIIEVQMGDYLEEDDIVRFEDDFGRK